MSDTSTIGSVEWADLTVKDCERVRDFYQAVVGWQVSPVEMEGYDDYSMVPPTGGEPAAGICHAAGPNENMPAQWLIYIRVEDLAKSIEKCFELGGKLLIEPRDFGSYGTICVIQDPAGAVCALQSVSR